MQINVSNLIITSHKKNLIITTFNTQKKPLLIGKQTLSTFAINTHGKTTDGYNYNWSKTETLPIQDDRTISTW